MCHENEPTRRRCPACPGGLASFEQENREEAAVIDRRRALTLLLLAALASPAAAQTSAKSVTLVVPYAAGGGTDTVARLIREQMARALARNVIIENVVGGGSTIANDRVARSAPDGSTVLINHVALLAAPSLFNKLRYVTPTAFETVGLVDTAAMLLVGRSSIAGSGATSYAESA